MEIEYAWDPILSKIIGYFTEYFTYSWTFFQLMQETCLAKSTLLWIVHIPFRNVQDLAHISVNCVRKSKVTEASPSKLLNGSCNRINKLTSEKMSNFFVSAFAMSSFAVLWLTTLSWHGAQYTRCWGTCNRTSGETFSNIYIIINVWCYINT